MPRWVQSKHFRGKAPPRHREPDDENQGQRRAYCADCRIIQPANHQCTPICQRCGTPFFGGMGCEPTSYCGALPCCGCCDTTTPPPPPPRRQASNARLDLEKVDEALAQYQSEQSASQATSPNQPKEDGKAKEGKSAQKKGNLQKK
ncbi:uncharacterized protein N7483_005845 [Penicillium malachiteum]|uniref:uncharacterized protein n=1 Tax=Penicillium malachiteum TaxID=1324776 RepID=UPI002547EBFC|nr:uncharacterized protein N7483_005845 [Penicillium malachiteum]KAJ5731337.1 hypothetical protein N7483_005845 [Penicillium malachiteum]